MIQVMTKIMPIFLLFGLGYVFYAKQVVRQESMNDLKKMVMHIALPATLFVTFINMSFQAQHLLVVVIMIVFMGLSYGAGRLINKIKWLSHFLNPFLTTGYCFGLLGVPLFAIVFGEENIGLISILGLANELFVWTIYFMLIKIKLNHEKPSLEMIKGILKSPLIISIVLGVLINVMGILPYLETTFIWQGIYSTVEYLKSICTPLMLIIIGYGLRIDKRYLKASTKLLLVRTTIILSLGYLFKYLFINQLIAPDPLFNAAYFTFLVLPPLYTLPIFVGQYGTIEEEELANNTIVLGTLLSILLFSSYVIYIS